MTLLLICHGLQGMVTRDSSARAVPFGIQSQGLEYDRVVTPTSSSTKVKANKFVVNLSLPGCIGATVKINYIQALGV
jgi:hypothetical protein